MKLHILPKEIATQIVLLLIISAVIFHLCISAAFFIGRYYPSSSSSEPPSENRFIMHIADFIKLANAQSKSTREEMLAWLASRDPELDLKIESGTEAPHVSPQKSPLVEAIQNRVGQQIEAYPIDVTNGRKRTGFRFEDGMALSVALPREFGHDHPPPPPPDGFHGDGHRPPPPPGGPPVFELVFATLFFIAISFTIFLLWAVVAVMRPLRKFATTVDDFTVDGDVTLLAENGPSELRGAADALNRMRERVKAMIEQRTQMLAAISHDLRTPITRMRLRAEFIESDEIREPILRDIEQMNAMVHSALSFIRDGVEVQRNTLLDLSALLQTACDEFADMGHQVTYKPSAPISIRGNGDELYRAVTNLVSNAVRFGTQVEIHLRQAAGTVEIDVIDDGPGIPADQKLAMLAPFARGDTARPVENLQGFGLGLPIVQAIVKSHRGLLTLLDRDPHGLIVRMILPC